MPRFLNNRRRFLGFLALLGAPTLARAQTTPVEVTCEEALIRETNVKANYYRRFDLGDGKLTPVVLGDYSDVSGIPTKVQFTDGFSDAAVAPDTPPDPNDPFFGDVTKFRITWDSDGNPGASFSAAVRVPGAVTQCGVVLVTTAGQLAATSGGFPPSATDPSVLDIYANWEPAPGQVLTGPIQIGIYFNNAVNAIFDFDLSAQKPQDMFNMRNNDLLSRTGLSVDPVTNVVTGAETCKYIPDATSDDYSGYGGAAPCFFTTAAVDTLGLSDDCWELKTLRAFRDGPLGLTEAGRALTARYYACAPRLVAGIARRRDAARVWIHAYWTHILPCAVMARLGLVKAAVSHYTRLFHRLEQLAT